MDQTLSINGVAALTAKLYSPAEWLTYYRNSWTRNVVALTIDVQDDIARVAQDGAEEVYYLHPDVQQLEAMPVAKRLEHRKADLSRALMTLASIEVLAAEDAETFAKRQSAEALAPAPVVVPEEVKKDEGVKVETALDGEVDKKPDAGAAI